MNKLFQNKMLVVIAAILLAILGLLGTAYSAYVKDREAGRKFMMEQETDIKVNLPKMEMPK